MDWSIDTAMTLESDGAVMRTVYIMAKEDDLMMITTSTFGRQCCNIDNSVIAGSKHYNRNWSCVTWTFRLNKFSTAEHQGTHGFYVIFASRRSRWNKVSIYSSLKLFAVNSRAWAHVLVFLFCHTISVSFSARYRLFQVHLARYVSPRWRHPAVPNT